MKSKKKRGKDKGAPKERPQTNLHTPATTANQQQEASITNVVKTDNWGKASTLSRCASFFTWCIDKGAEAWEKLKDFNWPDLPG